MNLTWDSRINIFNSGEIMFLLRSAGFPLSSNDSENGDSENSKLVCLAEVQDKNIIAIVATPSGLVYKFTEFDIEFWSFAARNYYFVTGNMSDREHVAKLTNLDTKEIKGKTLMRGKSSCLSQMSLDIMINQLKPRQESLI